MVGRKTRVTPVRNVRVPDGLWHEAQAKAAEEGITLTAVILTALHRYVSTPAKPSPPPP